MYFQPLFTHRLSQPTVLRWILHAPGYGVFQRQGSRNWLMRVVFLDRAQHLLQRKPAEFIGKQRVHHDTAKRRRATSLGNKYMVLITEQNFLTACIMHQHRRQVSLGRTA